MIVAGFTGTQIGMTVRQSAELARVLMEEKVDEFHHGDCIGADAQAHEIAYRQGIKIVIHPPTDPRKRAYCRKHDVIVLPEKPYLVRNHDIVDASNFLIAAPKNHHEELRSGTWATIRYARKQNKRVRMLWL